MSYISSFNFKKLLLKEIHWQEVPNFVFVLRSHPPFFDDSSTTVEVSSPYVRKRLPSKMSSSNFNQLLSIATSYRELSRSLFGPLAGHQWQLSCQYVLTVGGTVEVRSLTGDYIASAEISLPSREWRSLRYEGRDKDKIMFLDLDDKALYWSEQENFPGIEGFAVSSDPDGKIVFLFQSTLEEKRDFDALAVSAVLKAILNRNTKVIRVEYWYLVMPVDFAKFALNVPKSNKIPSELTINGQTLAFEVKVATFRDE